MDRKAVAILCALVSFAILHAALPCAAADPGAPSLMPPNEELITRALKARGVIPAWATAREAHAIYTSYVRRKLGRREDRPHPIGAASLRRGEAAGRSRNRHGRFMRPNNEQFDNILVLLVEFAGADGNRPGPLHNELPQPAPGDNVNYWRPDFNPEHYQTMLFSRKPGARSMAAYFLEQSGGAYAVDGRVYGWVQVPHSEWYYGADGAADNDNLNGPVWRVVRDAVAAAGDSIPWARFDTEDPYDLDGDGNTEEPDGYVDHIQIVHAGAGQEAGGGVQGDDAIWSHSWWADAGAHGPGYGGVPTADPDVWVGPYTIQPEDGTIGVFCHEFGHDLGLPDLYDTIYSGEASTGFWTLMAGGSWLGYPGEALGTCPAPMGAWEKYLLGWLDPVVVNPREAKRHILLKAGSSAGPAGKAILVNLPAYTYTFAVNTPHGGGYEWYSDHGDGLNNTLTRTVSLPAGAVLRFWTWYDIEFEWDYGYVEVSTDGGATWATVPGNLTSDNDPNGNNPEGNGLTGQSDGWVEAVHDLSAYGGQTVLLRFRYKTDAYVSGLGWTIDDLRLVDAAGNVIFADDAEGGNPGWTAAGWSIFAGAAEMTASHYYIAEWRVSSGFDVSMTNWYNMIGDATVENFSASPGLLLWYRNGRYTDNWAGAHPWAGQILVVDAHPRLVLADDLAWLAADLFEPDPGMGLPFRTRIQLADAAFGLSPVPAQPITSWFGEATNSQLPALPGTPVFDDSLAYLDTSWEPWFDGPYGGYIRNSISSVRTPTYGLRIEVINANPHAGMVCVDFSGFTP